MSLIAFGDRAADLAPLVDALEARGLVTERAADEAYRAAADGAPEVIASSLIASERLLTERRPTAVLVAGHSNGVLAVGLVASKLEIPLIVLTTDSSAAERDEGRNAHLLGLLADLVVEHGQEDPAGVIHAWLEGG